MAQDIQIKLNKSDARKVNKLFNDLEKLGTKEVSTFIFLVPSSALILSAIFLDEKITFNTILGTICTIVAIHILNNLNIFFLFFEVCGCRFVVLLFQFCCSFAGCFAVILLL